MGCTSSHGIPSDGTHPSSSHAAKQPVSTVAGSYIPGSDSSAASRPSGGSLTRTPSSKAASSGNQHSNTSRNNSSSSSSSSANGKRNGLVVGQSVFCRDRFQSKFTGEWMHKWRKASVVAVEHSGKLVLIHFEGWSDMYDIWIDLSTELGSIAPPTMLGKEDCEKGTPLTAEQKNQVYAFVGADRWDSTVLEGSTSTSQLSSPPPPPYEWTESPPRKQKGSSKAKAGANPDISDSVLCPPGTMLDVLDIFYKKGSDQPSHKWRKARVIDSSGTSIRVNFIGWDSKFDENLDLFRDSHRISEFGTKSTEQTSKSVAMSRSPGSVRKSVTGNYLSPTRPAASTSHPPATPIMSTTPATVAMTATPATPFESSTPAIHTPIADAPSPPQNERSNSIDFQDGYLSAAAPYGLQTTAKSSPRSGKPSKALREEAAATASSTSSDPMLGASSAKPVLRRIANKDTRPPTSSPAPAAAETISGPPESNPAVPAPTFPPVPTSAAAADTSVATAVQPSGRFASEPGKAGKVVSIEAARIIPDAEAAGREASKPPSEEAKSTIFGGLFKPFKSSGTSKPPSGEQTPSPPPSPSVNGQATAQSSLPTATPTSASSGSNTAATTADGNNGQSYYTNSILSSRAIFKRIMQFVNSKSSSETSGISLNGHGNGLHSGSSRSKREAPKSEEDQQVEELMAQTAEEMKEEIERERKFIESLGAKGLHVIEVEGDGNCLFRAVSHQLFLNEDHHEELRNWCVDHLISHKERFQVFCPDNFDDYIESMRQQGTWGDDLEIRALEEIIDRNIRIYSSDAADPTVPINNNFEEESLLKGLTPLSLSYHGQNHYNSIYDERTPLPLPTRSTRILLNARMKLLDQRPPMPSSGYGGASHPPIHQLHPYATPHGQAIPPMMYPTRNPPPSSPSSANSAAIPHHSPHMHPPMHPGSAPMRGGHGHSNLPPPYGYPHPSPYSMHNYHNPSMHPPPQAYLPPPRSGHMPVNYRPAPQPVSSRQPRYY